MEAKISGTDQSAISELGSLPYADENCSTASYGTLDSQSEPLESYNRPISRTDQVAASETEFGLNQDGILNPGSISEENTGAFCIGTDLELLLQNSRAYSHGQSRNSQISLPWSHNSTARWSSLPEISLSQVTNMSVLSLPISIHELWNQQHYHSALETQRLNGKSHKDNGFSLTMRKRIQNRKTWIGQLWLDAKSEAKSRKGLPPSLPIDLVPDYNLVPLKNVTSVRSPQVKLLLAGMFTSGLLVAKIGEIDAYPRLLFVDRYFSVRKIYNTEANADRLRRQPDHPAREE